MLQGLTYLKNLLVFSAIVFLSSCFSGPEFYQQEGNAADVEVALTASYENGVTTGSLDPNSSVVQTLSATDGSVAGSSVSFPPGSLAVDTNVSIQEGGSIAGASFSDELGIGDVGLAGAGPSVNISSSEDVDAANPFTLQIPMNSGSSLHLNDENDLIIVIYRVRHASDKKNFAGLFLRDQLTIADGKVKFQTKYFGSYQVAKSSTKIDASHANKKVESSIKPTTKNEIKEKPAISWNLESPVVDSSTRSAKVKVSVSGFENLVKCIAIVDDDKSGTAISSHSITDGDQLGSFGSGYEQSISAANDDEHSLYVKFDCVDSSGRQEISDWSSEIKFEKKDTGSSGGTTPTVANPTAFVAVGYSNITIKVGWTAASGVAGYKIAYSNSATPDGCSSATDVGNVTEHKFRKLPQNTTYYFRLCSYDSSGNLSTGVTATGATLNDTSNPCTTGSINGGSCNVNTVSGGNVIISGTSNVTIAAGISPSTSLVIDVHGNVTINANITVPILEVYGANITVGGVQIDASGGGSTGGSGIAAGQAGHGSSPSSSGGGQGADSLPKGGGGGAHYGNGGASANSIAGGTAYGAVGKHQFGSGGGGASGEAGADGGDGGGMIFLIADSTVDIKANSYLKVYGMSGGGSSNGGGGGGGGYIYVNGTSLDNSNGGNNANLQANGGDGGGVSGTSGGGGGGGVIQIDIPAANRTASWGTWHNCDVTGGISTGGTSGSSGYDNC